MLGIILDDLKEDVTKLTDESRGYVAEIDGIHTEDVEKEYETIKENLLNKDGTLNIEFIKTKLFKAVGTMYTLNKNATEICECCGSPKLSDKDTITYNEAIREVDVIDYALYQKYSDYDTYCYKPQNDEKVFDELYDKANEGEIDDVGLNFSFVEMVLKNGEHYVNVNRFEFLKLLMGQHAELSNNNSSVFHHDFNFKNMSKELADLILFYRETLLRCRNYLEIADGFSGIGFICLENYIMSELTKNGYFEDCEDEDTGYSIWNPQLWTEKYYANVDYNKCPHSLD